MTNGSKSKGDRAELEIASLLADLTGHPVRRKLGAGRLDDTGDLDGIPDTVVQVANWAQVAAMVSQKPLGAEVQRVNAGAGYAVTFVRIRGGIWRAVLTPEQWVAYHQATLGGSDEYERGRMAQLTSDDRRSMAMLYGYHAGQEEEQLRVKAVIADYFMVAPKAAEPLLKALGYWEEVNSDDPGGTGDGAASPA